MRECRITTAQIARIANVSQGTVDRALNNRTGINARTKDRILQIAKKYGYRECVDSVEDKCRGQIGIIVLNLNNEYFSELITEFEYALRGENYGTVVMMTHCDPHYETECIRNLYNMGVDGIVLCSVNSGTDFDNYLSLFDIPIVSVGNRVESIPYVGIDDYRAMREMTLHVMEGRPEDIIYFSPALNYSGAGAQRLRYEGFLNAIGDKKCTVVTDVQDIKEHYDSKTSVICSTDYYALKLHFKGCDAQITGFDNISFLDKYNIPVDSVGYSMAEIASGAVELIKSGKRENKIVEHYIVQRS